MLLPRLLPRASRSAVILTRSRIPYQRTSLTLRTYASSSPSSSEDPSSTSGGSRSKEATESGSSPTGGKLSSSSSSSSSSQHSSPLEEDSSRGLKEEDLTKPTISSRFTPGQGQDEPSSEEKKREVEQHNREFAEGHDRAPKAPGGDKVDKAFWQGHGGRDQES